MFIHIFYRLIEKHIEDDSVLKKIRIVYYSCIPVVGFCLFSLGDQQHLDEITKRKTDTQYSNGDLNNSFANQRNKKRIEAMLKDSLVASGWKEQPINNGLMSSCYNFKPKRSKIRNHLEVYVGSGTDVVIKLINVNTEKCIRYVYINSQTSYRITNIPEGRYYLKIAYGRNWLSTTKNGKCIGKFIRNSLYEKGTDILDYYIKIDANSRRIPSFKLQLDVIQNQSQNAFTSSNISEFEFNL